MSSSEQIASTILNLTLDQYFSESEEFITELEMKIADTDFLGLAINTPAKIPVDKHDQLPLILATRQTNLRAWQVTRDLNCILVAADLNTEEVHFAQLFADAKAETFVVPVDASRPPKPEGTQATAVLTSVNKVDAKTILDLPWKAGDFALSIIMYDWISNSVGVELLGQDKAPGFVRSVSPLPNIDVAPQNEQQRNQDKHVFPHYLPCSKTPKLSGPGVSFVMDPKPDQNALPVFGTFQTKVGENYLPADMIMHSFTDGRNLTVAAVVPVTFAIVGLDFQVPMSFNWAIPIYSEEQLQPGEDIHGYFTVDPFKDTDLMMSPGNYMAYVVMGAEIYGPVQFKWSFPSISPDKSKVSAGSVGANKDNEEVDDLEDDLDDENIDEDNWT